MLAGLSTLLPNSHNHLGQTCGRAIRRRTAAGNQRVPKDVGVSIFFLLVTAQKLIASQENMLWVTLSETPKALQASECSELLDLRRASCWISAQH